MIIPVPTYQEPEIIVPEGEIDYTHVRQFLNCVPWKCVKCGLTNFGRNEKCADFTCQGDRP